MKTKKTAVPKLTSLEPESTADFRFVEYPMYYIGQIQRQNFANLSAALKPYDLIPLEWRALAQLQEKDGISVSELADIVVSERSALSRVIGTMEQKKLVRRQAAKKDRRTTLVFIARKGQRIFNQILPIVRKQLAWSLAGLSGKEKASLMSLLNKLKDNVQRSPFD